MNKYKFFEIFKIQKEMRSLSNVVIMSKRLNNNLNGPVPILNTFEPAVLIDFHRFFFFLFEKRRILHVEQFAYSADKCSFEFFVFSEQKTRICEYMKAIIKNASRVTYYVKMISEILRPKKSSLENVYRLPIERFAKKWTFYFLLNSYAGEYSRWIIDGKIFI